MRDHLDLCMDKGSKANLPVHVDLHTAEESWLEDRLGRRWWWLGSHWLAFWYSECRLTGDQSWNQDKGEVEEGVPNKKDDPDNGEDEEEVLLAIRARWAVLADVAEGHRVQQG